MAMTPPMAPAARKRLYQPWLNAHCRTVATSSARVRKRRYTCARVNSKLSMAKISTCTRPASTTAICATTFIPALSHPPGPAGRRDEAHRPPARGRRQSGYTPIPANRQERHHNRRYTRPGDRPGWSSEVRENECFVKPHLLRVLAQDSWPAAPVDLICMMRERWSQSPRTRRSPLATSSMTEAGSWPAGVSRSVWSRVTKAVTLTTESLGRPEMAAGRKTLPGMVARAVLEVMTAAMVVFSRLALKGSDWITRSEERRVGKE